MPGTLFDASPDVSLGIHWRSLPQPQPYSACATNRLAFAFADAEEKKGPKKEDECVGVQLCCARVCVCV
jgi:hypothetical protein